MKAKEKYDRQKLEEEKAQKYNPDDLFKKKHIESVIGSTEKDTIENSNLPIEVKKERRTGLEVDFSIFKATALNL